MTELGRIVRLKRELDQIRDEIAKTPVHEQEKIDYYHILLKKKEEELKKYSVSK